MSNLAEHAKTVGDGIAALLAIREYLQAHHEVAPHSED